MKKKFHYFLSLLISFILLSCVGCVEVSPQIVFRVATEDEAFEYIIYQSKLLPYSKKHGYNITLPKHEAFKKLYENPGASFDRQALKKIFVTEFYNKSSLEQRLKVAYNIKWVIEKALQKLAKLKKKWGFDVKQKYEIVFTPYGMDAIYQHSPELGKITFAANSDIVRQPGGLEVTAIYEIVNIGIDNLVKRYNLGHWQRERIIDLIIMFYLKDVVPYYVPVPLNEKKGDKRLDLFIDTEKAVEDLPAAIEKFKAHIEG